MSVWLCIPSAAPAAKANPVLKLWRDRGYKISVWRDIDADEVDADKITYGQYPGYAKAVNFLCRDVIENNPDVQWCVTGGDDVHPCDESPEVIAHQCEDHFNGTLGIMECTGDKWMVDQSGKCAAERVCIAPWMGRDWILRGYGGHGPLCEDYFHFFVDEELKNVAERLGILWQRPDLKQYHANWQRIDASNRPKYLEKAAAGWAEAKAIFERRQDAGFPGHELAISQ